ncbi:hypothetical protein PGT21_028265 [Puccinia graminis f. sp. tritici]|uniref:Uncharacterized protein n=1 Tax=Puccinia graminis f. sp. tritici TaxID=56615 RepID=A0A5B0R772_PUCGR|nr:hypothetical protein PGT21_028265 [Puccinia graminis f. sp. tritici]KAA1120774.1 hypothetical protein PGTUg99_014294 [Puccinia graminis f. sp. tritici]
MCILSIKFLALIFTMHLFSLVMGEDFLCGTCPGKKATKSLKPTGAEGQYSCKLLGGPPNCLKFVQCKQYSCEKCGWAALKATGCCSDNHPAPSTHYYMPGQD